MLFWETDVLSPLCLSRGHPKLVPRPPWWALAFHIPSQRGGTTEWEIPSRGDVVPALRSEHAVQSRNPRQSVLMFWDIYAVWDVVWWQVNKDKGREGRRCVGWVKHPLFQGSSQKARPCLLGPSSYQSRGRDGLQPNAIRSPIGG